MATVLCSDVLDHPEVLDRENLIEILYQRCIPVHEINNLEKEKLVLLFYKYVSPLPQRLHQLKRTKREPPVAPPSKKNVISTTFSQKNQSRKRLQVVDNAVPIVKVPKSDLEHVLINNGPSKKKTETNHELSTASKTEVSGLTNLKQNSEVKSKPVKLNRRSLNLDLSLSVNPSPSVVNNKQSDSNDTCKDQQDSFHKQVSLESSSSSDDVSETKKKFQRIAISWP